MSKQVLTDLNFDNTSRCINMPDPVNDGDAVSKNFIKRFNAKAVAETSTSSTVTYLSKVSITTTALPTGDYKVSWSFKWRASNANRGIRTSLKQNAVEQFTATNFSASVSEVANLSGFKTFEGISGVQTFDFSFRVGIGATTVFMSEAHLEVVRIA